LGTNSAERFRITSSGNIGIGTDNPGARTHIDSVTSNTPLVVEASENNRSRIVFRNNVETGTECNIELFDDDLRFVTNSAERLRIDSSGNLLLKTGEIDIQGGNKTVKTSAGFLQLGTSGSHHTAVITSGTERLRIDSSGRLLLGLNSSIGGNAIFQVQGSGNRKAHFHQPDTGGCLVQFTNTTTGTTTTNGLEIGLGGAEQGQIWNYHNSYFRIATNNTERLRIDSSGHLLHGVTADEDTSGNSGLRFINAGDIQIDGDQQALVFRSTNNTAQLQSAIEWWNENGAGVQSKIACDRTAVSQAPSDLVFYTSSNVDLGGAGNDGAITERLRITSAGLLGVNETSPDTNLHISRSASQNDTHGILKVESTSTATGAATNASLIAKNRYGWSQFMQWESNGLRIGSRSTTTGGSGEVHITSGSDAVSLKIDGSGRVTKPLQPAFRAGRSSNYSPGAGSDIIFDTVSGGHKHNVGNHYNTSNGRFTAPVAGVYTFTAHVIWQNVSNGQNMADCFHPKINGVVVGYSGQRAEYIDQTTGNNGYYTDFMTYQYYLSAGDYITINNQFNLQVHGNSNYTTFSGHLVC
jgi:hypothetical protein